MNIQKEFFGIQLFSMLLLFLSIRENAENEKLWKWLDLVLTGGGFNFCSVRNTRLKTKKKLLTKRVTYRF